MEEVLTIDKANVEKANNDLAFWLKRWSSYPLGYAIECCGVIPSHQQAQILLALPKYRFVAVRSGHGIGKSFLIGLLVNWYLDTQKVWGKSCRVPITGSSYDQLKDVILPAISNMNSMKWDILSKNYVLTSDGFYHKDERENWFASLRTARVENPTALQGFHECFFVIEEAFGVPDPIFEVARGAMGDPGSYGLMVGNPTTNSGYCYNAFHSKTTPWHCLHFSSADSLVTEEYSYKYIDPLGDVHVIKTHGRQTIEWVNDMKAEYGENSNTYKTRVLGEFANVSADVVIDAKYLANVNMGIEDNEISKRRKVMGVDVARSGKDDTAIVIRQGRKVLWVESWHGCDLVETRMRVEARYREFKCDCCLIDTIGVGAGVYDEMRRNSDFNVREVIVSNSAPEDTDASCVRLRDYLWWKGRKFFKDYRAIFSYDGKQDDWIGLKSELCVPTYKFTDKGKVKVESKDELIKRGVKSPNRADAFLMTLLEDFDISGASTEKVKANVTKLQYARRHASFAVL